MGQQGQLLDVRYPLGHWPVMLVVRYVALNQLELKTNLFRLDKDAIALEVWEGKRRPDVLQALSKVG